MPTPVSFPLFHVTDPSTGMPLVGGLVWSYGAGGSTPIDTWAAWSPSGGYASKNTNPIVLDADGNSSIYINLPTKLVVEYPPPIGQTHGTVIDTFDHLEAAPYNSYIVIGNTVPPTPGTNQLGLYTIGTTLYIIDSTGAITSPATAQSIQQQSFTAAAAGGTGDAITATLNPPLTSLIDKIRVWITAAAANTTTIPTFSPNGLTAKTIVKWSNTPLLPGDIPGANAIILLEYNSTLDKWVLIDPANNTKSASTTLTTDATKTIATGISPGTYKLYLSMLQNTTGGYPYLQFNADGGSNYNYNNIFAQAALNHDLGNGTTKLVIGNNTYPPASATIWSADLTLICNGNVIMVTGNVHMNDGTDSINYIVNGAYNGAATLSSILLGTSAGTLTGTANLYIVP